MRVLVTGASRGIGLELVRQHAMRGDEVQATCRDPAASRQLEALVKDLPGQRVPRPGWVQNYPALLLSLKFGFC